MKVLSISNRRCIDSINRSKEKNDKIEISSANIISLVGVVSTLLLGSKNVNPIKKNDKK